MNIVIMQGRLTADPEIQVTSAGKNLVQFSLAVNRGKEAVDFFRCVAWDNTAEFINKYFNKGSGIIITGSLRQEKWKDEAEQNRESVKISVQSVEFPASKSGDSNNTASSVPDNITVKPPVKASDVIGGSTGSSVAVADSAEAQKLIEMLKDATG